MFPKICELLVVYRFYCMALFHSQERQHMISRIYFDLIHITDMESKSIIYSIIPQELEVLFLNYPYSLKTKSSQCHYVMTL